MRTLPSCICGLLFGIQAPAQLINGGFETLNSEGLPIHWQGNRVIHDLWVDENGVFHTDSLEFDGAANYLLNTTTPHSGAYAIELHNGYNHTTGDAIIGSWSAAEDTVAYAGFPILTIPSEGRPEALTFFGTVTLAGPDEVVAEIIVLDPDGFEIGHGNLLIGTATVGYQAFQVPVVYGTTDPAAFMQVRFATAETGASATLGTRFLIDDVSVTMQATSINALADDGLVRLFPNPADQQLSVATADGTPVLAMDVTDAAGRHQRMMPRANGTVDCSALAPGVYVLQVRTTQGTARQRLVVRH